MPRPAGDVHLPARQLLPFGLEQVQEGRVAGEGGHVGGSGVQIAGRHGVAGRLIMSQEGPAGGPDAPPRSSIGHVGLRQLQILVVGRGPRQLHQGDLDPGVAGDLFELAFGVDSRQQVGRLDRGIEVFAPAGRFEVRDRRLDEMSLAVRFARPGRFVGIVRVVRAPRSAGAASGSRPRPGPG